MLTTRTFCAFLLLLLALPVAAQTPEYYTHTQVRGDSVFFRWEPASIAAFRHVTNGGMTLELYGVRGTERGEEGTLVTSERVTPLGWNDWYASLPGERLDSFTLQSVHTERARKDLPESEGFALNIDVPNADPRRLDTILWGVNVQAGHRSWRMTEKSGFGRAYPTDDRVDTYLAKVYPTPAGDTLFFVVPVDGYRAPRVPELNVRWRDRKAELNWLTHPYASAYYAYTVDRSVEGGPWESILPYGLMNNDDREENVPEPLQSLYTKDQLPNNEDSIRYRLYGLTYFGARTEKYSEVKGTGMSDIRQSPLLLETVQTDSNYAIIRWDFPEEQEALVREFRIVHTDTAGTDYRVAMEGIPAGSREVALPMIFDDNYFRVQAVSTSGTVYSSFESLIMAYDVTPPVPPADFTGYIDTAGVAHLSWVRSDEPDLKGYYLFKGYFRDAELAMITPYSVPGPELLDTTPIDLANDSIYYQLRAIDYRGNGSEFTPILALKKPDIYPPSPPRFSDVENDGKTILLKWVSSPSDDVVQYTLWRRELTEGGKEGPWTPVLSFPTEQYRGAYRDSLVEPGSTYAYTLRVLDDDQLRSDFCQPATVKVKDYGLRSAIQGFSATYSGDVKAVELTWSYAERPREFYVYRGAGNEPVTLLKVIDGGVNRFVDTGVRPADEGYRYLIRAVFNDGDVSPFTDTALILTR